VRWLVVVEGVLSRGCDNGDDDDEDEKEDGIDTVVESARRSAHAMLLSPLGR